MPARVRDGRVVSTAYREYRDGHGGRNLWLNNYPVTGVDFASTDRDDAFAIAYDATDASYATVEVTTSELKLRTRVDGVLSTSTLTLSDYATLSALETAVEAVTGWSVSIPSSYTSYAPTSLCPTPALRVNDSVIDLEVPDEGEVWYELKGETGRLYNPYGWPRGVNNVYIEYTAGYARADMPEPIRSACMELVALMYRLSEKDPTLKSETIGEYKYETAAGLNGMLAKGGGTGLIMAKLGMYRRNMVFGA